MATDRTFFAMQTVSTTLGTPSHPNQIPNQVATELLSSVLDLGDERSIGLRLDREALAQPGWLASAPVLEMTIEAADDAAGMLGTPGTWVPIWELAHRDWAAAGPGVPIAAGVVSPHRYVRARGRLRPSAARDAGSARFSLTARSTGA